MALVVGCATAFDIGTLSVTVGGNAMTKSTSTVEGTPYQTYIFTYANPPSGSQAIQVSWDSGGSDHRVLCGAVSFSGVNQSQIVDVSTVAYAGGGTIAPSLTTLTANAVLLGVVNDNGSGSYIGVPLSGQVVKVQNTDAGTNNYTLTISTRQATTTGSYSDSWNTFGGPTQESYIAIKPGP